MTPLEEAKTLWKKMSETPDQKIPGILLENWKNELLGSLGIEGKLNGCPLCNAYIGTKRCPIGDCSRRNNLEYERMPCERNSPYREYTYNVCKTGMHSQALAKTFYEYLLTMKEPQPTLIERLLRRL